MSLSKRNKKKKTNKLIHTIKITETVNPETFENTSLGFDVVMQKDENIKKTSPTKGQVVTAAMSFALNNPEVLSYVMDKYNEHYGIANAD